MRQATILAAIGMACSAARLGAQSVELVNVAPHVSHVVSMAHAGDGSGRVFFVQQFGRILIYDGTTTHPVPFLDISGLVRTTGGEEGLLGLAFHPQYETNGFFFVYYTNPAGDNVIARYHVSGAPNVADPASGQVVLTISHPISEFHNGGQLQFGPDGYLYVGVGDGRLSLNARFLTNLLGKVLRIDVNALPYTIPPGNPFATTPGARPEIWAYGLRNPWRFSFDRGTGRLFIADVGEERPGEIDLQPAGAAGGANYGWDLMQGEFCHNAPFPCATPDLTLPIIDLYHPGLYGCATIGGYVYRGTAMPGLVGTYVFSDFCSGDVWRARQDSSAEWTWSPAFLSNIFGFSSLGEDEAGELYIAQLIYELKGPVIDGNVYRLVAGPPPPFAANDATVDETPQGTVAHVQAFAGMSYLPIIADYTTIAGTATAGSDYVTTSGTITFAPWTNYAELTIPIPADLVDEDDETFTVRFSNVQNAVLTDDSGVVTIHDDDPPPRVFPSDCSAVEGDTGSTPCATRVWLEVPSAKTATVVYAAAGSGSAVEGVDFLPVSGTLTFAPGVVERTVDVPVLGDTAIESDETFKVLFAAPVNALLGPGNFRGTIVDDDGIAAASSELTHGARVDGDLAGGTADLYRIQLTPYGSYEIVLSDQSGDAVDATLQLLSADLSSVLASGVAHGAGGARTMRLANLAGAPQSNRIVRVSRPGCSGCDAQDTYRLTVRETTVRFPRFNNKNGQSSVVLVVNPAAELVTVGVHFWAENGAEIANVTTGIPAHTTLVLTPAGLPATSGHAGSITVAHDAAYGGLVGKVVSVDPGTGASFDTPLEFRPH